MGIFCMLNTTRCKDCGLFKELAAFRHGGAYRYWQPLSHGPWQLLPYGSWRHRNPKGHTLGHITDFRTCNTCFADKYGLVALQQSLAAFALELAEDALADYSDFLMNGWSDIINGGLRRLMNDERERHLVDEIAAKASRVLHQDTSLKSRARQQFVFREGDMEALHAIQAEVIHLVYHETTQKSRENIFRSRAVEIWLDDYEKGEGAYRIFKEVIRRIKESPGVLDDYTLLQAAQRNE